MNDSASSGHGDDRCCTVCGRSVEDAPYEYWLFSTCPTCVAEPAPDRWGDGRGVSVGTYRKWRYFPDWHMNRTKQTDNQCRTDEIATDGGRSTADKFDPTITFGPSAAEDVVDELGFAVNDGGVIVDKTGDPVEPAFGDAPLTLSELGGFGKGEDGEIFIIGNDFPSLVEYINRFEVPDTPDTPDEPKDGDSDVDH